MTNLYFRVILVAVGSATLAWLALRVLIAKYRYDVNMGTLEFFIRVFLVSSVSGFAGIILIDGARYVTDRMLYWLVPILTGSVSSFFACTEILLPPKQGPDYPGTGDNDANVHAGSPDSKPGREAEHTSE